MRFPHNLAYSRSAERRERDIAMEPEQERLVARVDDDAPPQPPPIGAGKYTRYGSFSENMHQVR